MTKPTEASKGGTLKPAAERTPVYRDGAFVGYTTDSVITSPVIVGQRFDTPYESGCTVTREPDAAGEFLALDSDGVECSFNVSMVLPMEGAR